MIQQTLEAAAQCMRLGGVIIYPTETFYAVGCMACHEAALSRVYTAKHRAINLPLPIIAATMEHITRLARVDDAILPLIQHFWPGPLTVLLPAHAHLPPLLTGGTGRVAVRLSSHTGATALALAVGDAIVSSSANISGQQPVTCPTALDPHLCNAVDGVLTLGNAPKGGMPSTLVELTPKGKIHILRHGAITAHALREAGFSL